MKRIAIAAVAGLLAGSLAACGADEKTTSQAGPATLTVYAASSLKATFEQLAERFEAEHDSVEVEFNFAGSSDLAAQIQQGAPADVFASADLTNMDKLGADAVDPQDFATNTLEIVVPADNPAHVDDLADLAAQGIKLVVCAAEVPCGAAAARVEEAAKLDWSPVSEEQSVADVLNKVATGEADVGLVYATDVRAAGDEVQGVEIPAGVNAVNTYPIASVKASEHADLAAAWVELVTGAEGRAVLAAAGFGGA